MGKAAVRVLMSVLALWLVGVQPAQARWLRAESPKFIVYSDGGESGLRKFTQELENFDVVLRVLTDEKAAPSPNKLTVYLVSSQQMIQTFWPGGGKGVLGFYSAGADGIYAVAARNGAGGDDWYSGQQVVFHEYTHHFVAQYFPGSYPIWYQEGFAELCSTVSFKGAWVDFGLFMPARAYTLMNSMWLPARVLMSATDSRMGPIADSFYAESWLATHYLTFSAGRQAQLVAYLGALRKGDAPEAAFTNAFGMGYNDFDKALIQYRERGLPFVSLRNIALPAAPIAVTALPASADRLLVLHQRLAGGPVADSEGAQLLDQVRKAAAAFPDDTMALHTLAAAEIDYGDPDKADAPLDRLLAADPRDVEALDLKGRRFMAAAGKDPTDRADLFAKARPFFARAHQADPNDFQALYRYGLTFAALGGRPSDNTINVLLMAHDLAPQAAEISMTAAEALIRANQIPDAIVLLQPIAYSPHPGPLTNAARQMLARVQLGPVPFAAEARGPKPGDLNPPSAPKPGESMPGLLDDPSAGSTPADPKPPPAPKVEPTPR